MDTKEELIKYSEYIGVDEIGFCLAKPFYELKDILYTRDKSNYMCNLESRDYNSKIYPGLTLKDAKSFIVIVEAYDDNPPKNESDVLRGNISMAAVSEDYHKIVMSKLELLEECLHQLVDCNTMKFVDMSPFSDRAVAVRAGLGFIGKNSMLITNQYGSRVYIGYILTDYYIEPDEQKEYIGCGNCSRCVNSCPTGAIKDTKEIDCNLCISYLTQHKGTIDNKLKKKMGQQIYGCDVCQKVCPYNKVENKKLSSCIEPYPRYQDLLNISNKDFKKTYALSSAGWRGKKILQRNAIIALGNSMDKEALDILVKHLYDVRIDIRKEIIDAIINLSFIEGIELLKKMKVQEKNNDIIKLIDAGINILNKN
ncbi:epoxyqueuosine reductase [Vallitalea longa]|uniref:Epoxyqueuosine reductase n=1 Tax=Vallitalea longa TaxID=2936439 RepID=A0A9W5YAN4_9FIRM|nr:tRNA epoxyqueuosine(34) reductase QueG [Vallitalea longa]GKX28898.1 epoxyqueuosine reductase [Vallitalea longa]